MNICLISREYPKETARGGIGTYTFNLAHALAGLGHNVYVISEALEHDRDYKDEDVFVYRIKPKKLKLKSSTHYLINKIRWAWQVYRKFKQINKENKIDLVEAPEWDANGFFIVLFQRKRFITRLHTPSFLTRRLNNQKQDRILNKLEKFQTKRSLNISSNSFVLAKAVAKEWKMDLKKIIVIPNGISLQNHEVKIPQNSISNFILYFGRLETFKGVHILAQSLPEVFKKYPNLKFVFAGSDRTYKNGSMREFIIKCNKNFENNLVFTDHLQKDELNWYIKNSRFVVLPSLWEAFGYTVIEAMAQGKVVIGTDECGHAEIIENGKSGFLIKSQDVKVLGDKIIELLDRKDLATVEKNAYKRAKDFDIKKIALKIIDYYKQIIL